MIAGLLIFLVFIRVPLPSGLGAPVGMPHVQSSPHSIRLLSLPLAAVPAPPHSKPEAPDTQPLTPKQLRTRTQIYTALRIGGVLTTVALITLITLLLYKERRQPAPPTKQEEPG